MFWMTLRKIILNSDFEIDTPIRGTTYISQHKWPFSHALIIVELLIAFSAMWLAEENSSPKSNQFERVGSGDRDETSLTIASREMFPISVYDTVLWPPTLGCSVLLCFEDNGLVSLSRCRLYLRFFSKYSKHRLYFPKILHNVPILSRAERVPPFVFHDHRHKDDGIVKHVPNMCHCNIN